MKSRETIFAELSGVLVSSFELDPAAISSDADLYEDLELDSIDTIDLIVHVQDMLGCKVQPEQFKSARTVGDVVDIVDALRRA